MLFCGVSKTRSSDFCSRLLHEFSPFFLCFLTFFTLRTRIFLRVLKSLLCFLLGDLKSDKFSKGLATSMTTFPVSLICVSNVFWMDVMSCPALIVVFPILVIWKFSKGKNDG